MPKEQEIQEQDQEPTPEGQRDAEGLTPKEQERAKQLRDEQDRPIFNRLKELERKNTELQEKLVAKEEALPPAEPTPTNSSYGLTEEQWAGLEERYPDMSRDQIRATLEMTNSISQTHNAMLLKEINTLKLEIAKNKFRADKPDFDELEGEINKRLKTLPPESLNNPSIIEDVYYYVKGKKVEKERPAKGQGSQVLGALPTGGRSPAPSSKSTLTKAQEARMIEMGLSNPQDFLDIEKRRATARKSKK